MDSTPFILRSALVFLGINTATQGQSEVSRKNKTSDREDIGLNCQLRTPSTAAGVSDDGASKRSTE